MRIVNRLFSGFGSFSYQLLGAFSTWSQPANTIKEVISNAVALNFMTQSSIERTGPI
ncbi:hypothetical protein ACQR3P_18285 [Rhodococcus sp. IEGM1300]